MQSCVRPLPPHMRACPQYGCIDPSSEKPDFGACLWNVDRIGARTPEAVPRSKARTALELLDHSTKTFATRNAAGWRNVVQVHMVEEGGARREKIELENVYNWLTYQQYGERVKALAGGFAGLGLKAGDKLLIYAETQLDWMVCAYAAFCHNAIVVTAYATLGEDGAAHAINQTKVSHVVADAKLVKTLAKILPQCGSVKSVVTMTKCDESISSKIASEGRSLHSVDELVAKGKEQPAERTTPKPEDIAVIMYTSGTTGAPKGVQITHANLLASVTGVEHQTTGMVNFEDVYLAYLPLAHIMEMVAELAFANMGCAIGFGSPHTLHAAAVKLKKPESIGDAPLLGPTFMVFAPAVLDKVYASVQAQKDAAPALLKKIFQRGLTTGAWNFDKGVVGAPGLYPLAFRKVQALLGGRLKALMTGSAPLSMDIQRFTQTVFNAPVRQGYGLTETTAVASCSFWGDSAPRTVGAPCVNTVIRLADWPEGNYLNSDEKNPAIGMRRGEVLVGGPGISAGYFIDPANPDPELERKNKEEFLTIDGVRYFRTGDVGQITSNGCLQIIDRKKDLWKGPNGEYVALTKVEAALQLCEFTELPMCYGKVGGEFPVALICPRKARLEALGRELGKEGDFQALCEDPAIVDHVQKALKAVCKEKKLVAFEIPEKVALISELWTPENEMLTAAMKLKRPVIAEKHKEQIQKLYA